MSAEALYTATQIDGQFAKVMAENNARITELEMQVFGQKGYAEHLHKQLVETQSKNMAVCAELQSVLDGDSLPNLKELAVYLMSMHGSDALDSAITAAVEPYKRDAGNLSRLIAAVRKFRDTNNACLAAQIRVYGDGKSLDIPIHPDMSISVNANLKAVDEMYEVLEGVGVVLPEKQPE